ncbi:hypothetical protein IWX63_003100 [Arthrobacter sp. CAN_A2]|uniref:hypothetical protein n=1 Tax=Arthrobacter sp. CAN_A2 TaxID=2787718 RepID=UPI0018EFABA8
MSNTLDPQLSVELSKLAVHRGAVPTDGPASPTTEQLLASVIAFHDLVRTSTELQGQAVRAAHEAGVSWARIGTLLGTTRQAVQQRFDPTYTPREDHGDATRILGPVSRGEEMVHLAEAGRQGWRLIRSFHGEHVLEQHDDQRWEIMRVSVFSPRALPSRKDGWEAATTRFPDCFYVRKRRPERPADPSKT